MPKVNLSAADLEVQEDNSLFCRSCSAVADEGEEFCFCCKSYWADCSAGLWDDPEQEENKENLTMSESLFPTLNLRFVKRINPMQGRVDGLGVEIRVLQQMFATLGGQEVWQDVPLSEDEETAHGT